jgi:hypothetical protein
MVTLISKKTKQFLKLFICTAAITVSAQFTQAQTIPATNTGTPGLGAAQVMPTGWTDLIPSCDVNNTTGWRGSAAYAWDAPCAGVSVVNPPTGHTTWLGGLVQADGDVETISSTISGLTAGVQYRFTCYFANYVEQLSSGTTTQLTSAIVKINGTDYTHTFNNTAGNQCDWETFTVTFTATGTTAPITVRSGAANNSLGFWHVSIAANAVQATCAAGGTAPVIQ